MDENSIDQISASEAGASAEEWRPVPGYEGRYEVSNLGRVKSIERSVAEAGKAAYLVPERILRPSVSRSGFCTVHLSRNNVQTTIPVHRLVALAFVEGWTEETCAVFHKDGNYGNNAAGNLEWCASGRNVDAVKRRRLETRRKNGLWSHTPKAVELVHNGEVVARYCSAFKAAGHEAISATSIRNQCRGGKSRRRGYQWRYAETQED